MRGLTLILSDIHYSKPLSKRLDDILEAVKLESERKKNKVEIIFSW
ncbi:hypothetical protein ACFL0U_01340 [Pseudomonadota bacterium]